MSASGHEAGLFRRLAETGRRPLRLWVDGKPIEALDGDTLMVALLTQGLLLRHSEFGDGARAGFCMMGACQDCWVWTETGERLRACSTPATDSLRIVTREVPWPALP
ncbi:(2Fe-2S)-binding protein [Falsiroseomonas sp.]|uniref:(2Fe-2S)-binding protein n=1 Tax=Falsiroseomonas sp. TaxID=2870721 RepID=UPI003F7174E3